MKWYLFITVVSCIILACNPKQETKKVSLGPDAEAHEPTFNSQKFESSFATKLTEDTLRRAQLFADNQITSVTLISLLPDCQTLNGEEQCRETSVLTNIEGDSIKSVHYSDLQQISIDESRFGIRKTIHPNDIKKLLPPLFSGDEKDMVSFCYVPRHAIAFYGQNAELTGFIEICFECSESILILDSLNLPPLSQKALNGLGSLFLAYGFEEKSSQIE